MAFSKVKLTPSRVPAMTLVNLGINSKEEKKLVNEFVKQISFFSPLTEICIGAVGEVFMQSLSRTSVCLRSSGHSSSQAGFLLIRHSLAP